MKINKLIWGVWAAVALTGLTGCGGKVVIDQAENGQGGASGSSGTGSTGTGSSGTGSTGTGSTGTGSTGTGQTTGTSTGTGGNDVKASCGAICDAIQKGDCGQPGCLENCLDTYANAGECADEFAALVFCYDDHLDTLAQCGTPIACDSLKDAFNMCQNGGGCGPQSCESDDTGGCSCAVTCGNSKFSADCQLSPGGQICTCNANGMPVGKCMGMNTCDVFQGCCGPILFPLD